MGTRTAAERLEPYRRYPTVVAGVHLARELCGELDPADLVRRAPAHATVTVGTPVGAGLPAVRYLGNYELVTERARGGMGAVYRARQVTLNRPVALKMILAGTYAKLPPALVPPPRPK